ncbi:MAG: hypothetical protein AAGH74_01070 [Pseudomonadota bacterium]
MRAFVAGLAVSLSLSGFADASISNRVALKNERLDRSEYLQRCIAFFTLIAEFRDRRPGEAERLQQTASDLTMRAVDVLSEETSQSVEEAAEATRTAIETSLKAYRETLRDQFGPVQSATFRTYDLLLMQEDLKFCKDLTKAEGLAPRRPLPAR